MTPVYVGMGSNVERRRYLPLALELLHRRYGVLLVSSVYESEAVGFRGDPFFNVVVCFETSESVQEVGTTLKEIEWCCGRTRSTKRFGPRTLDADLLLFGDLVMRDGRMQLPREETVTRAFVLQPLAEIAPELIHPILGSSFGELWSAFDPRDCKIWKAEFQLDSANSESDTLQ